MINKEVKWHNEWFKVIDVEIVQTYLDVERRITIENEELTTIINEYEIEELREQTDLS